MKFDRTPAFRREAARLPQEHLELFKDVVRNHLLPALNAGAHRGETPWPKRLRIHKLQDHDVYSLTWNFASPDGRATFSFMADDQGEPVLIWRRIGSHAIYHDP
ncbi:hypothetical protein Aros01_03631 [Streptosporangium roseum]|uniref:Cytotoxic translational repressor of toxin-antitoxin stability system n=1 Tax=Streptosporangium roseum (strain ATCC 12428 / DSM 43021 / JCM 3005 / KCTC 9067 / NCIMB 10171 / NRRL 2505 / NI 9100) TaxID=479432 RepID=D2AVZ5_STRRD|nr:hypothetical protein Sros_1960 [Streptosporangium roseum DSM 43021]